jgi:ribosome-associated heat shock protein Hsp15
MNAVVDPDAVAQRLDKWLWYARFSKSRSLAAKLLASGRLRLSKRVISKAHQVVRIGDVLTFPQGPHIRVIEVVALARRRGPASEAETLYKDLAPPQDKPTETTVEMATKASPAARTPGSGRPTKRERRLTDRFLNRD